MNDNLIKKRKEYNTPKISCQYIYIEDCFATGSIQIHPGNDQGQVFIDNWQIGNDINSIDENTLW